MVNLELYYFYSYFLQLNLNILVFSSIIFSLIWLFSKVANNQILFAQSSSLQLLKALVLGSLSISFICHLASFFFFFSYSYSIYSEFLVDEFLVTPVIAEKVLMVALFFNFFEVSLSSDFFGLILLTLAYAVGILSLLALDTRIFYKTAKFYLFFHIFILIVFLFVTTSNLLYFFLLYEALLIPSFFIVYFVSPYRRALQASMYFVI
jgi:hypothetical protein